MWKHYFMQQKKAQNYMKCSWATKLGYVGGSVCYVTDLVTRTEKFQSPLSPNKCLGPWHDLER